MRVSVTTCGYRADRATLAALAELSRAAAHLTVRRSDGQRLDVVDAKVDPTPSSAGALILTLEERP